MKPADFLLYSVSHREMCKTAHSKRQSVCTGIWSCECTRQRVLQRVDVEPKELGGLQHQDTGHEDVRQRTRRDQVELGR